MIFSHGALNGAVLNALPLNEGGFRVPFRVVGKVESTATVLATPRRFVRTAGIAAIGGLVQATPRRGVRVASVVTVPATARMTRRRIVHVTGGLLVSFGVRVSCRVPIVAAGRIGVTGTIKVRWRDFGRLPDRRRIVPDPDNRTLLVQTQDRAIEVRPGREIQAPSQSRRVAR